MKTKFKWKYLLYVFALVLFVAWGWTTLYLHSYSYLWGGKDESAAAAAAAKKKILTEFAALQKNGATPEVLFEEREQLVLQCAQNNDHDEIRKYIDEEDASLRALAASEENSKLLIYDRLLLAHICLTEGRYSEGRDHLKEADVLVKAMSDKYGSDDCQFLILTLANENAVVDYLDANGTLDTKTRSSLFERCRTENLDLISRIDKMKADSSKYSDEFLTRIGTLKKTVISNLNMVREDIAHEDEFQHS